MREPGWDWAISDGEGLGCPQCGAHGTRRVRRQLTRTPLRWLREGGQLFPHGAECTACGYRWPRPLGVVFGGAPRPRWWALPWHVGRAVVVTVQQERTSEPVPWLYLASAGLGAGVGGALGVRRGRVGPGAALGAATGLLACWSAFAWTALVRHGTGTAVADAVLRLVSDPQRTLDRHALRDEQQAASAGFAPYGLDPSWEGRRFLVGASTSWTRGRERPRVTSLQLGHSAGAAAPADPDFVVDVDVLTRAPRGSLGDDEAHLTRVTTDELAEQLGSELHVVGERGAASERRAVVVVLDGTAVEATALHGDGGWIVLVRTEDVHVEVRGRGEVPTELRLVRVHDLTAYPSTLRSVVPPTR